MMSRLNLSSKSFPGVLEDMNILHEHGNCVRLEIGWVGGGGWKLEFSVNLNQIEIRFDLIRFD